MAETEDDNQAQCNRHGLSDFYADGRCKKCRKESNHRYWLRRKQRRSTTNDH